MFGFISVDKPVGKSSRWVVDLVKKIVRPVKVGHAGTLDPLASGVLVLGIGPATRLTCFVQQSPKSYVGTFQLGVCSPTDDLEGELASVEDAPVVSRSDLEQILPEFVGAIMQTPPAYSAVKIKGKRAYKLSRAGEHVPVSPRRVEVHSLSLASFDYPNFTLEIQCGGGTYIRSIGRDLGRRLQSAAVMTNLVRTSIGPFKIADSILPAEIVPEKLAAVITNPRDIFGELETVCLNDRQIGELRNGSLFAADSLGLAATTKMVMAVDQQHRLLALLERDGHNQFKPALNFCHYYQSLEGS